MYNLMLHEQVMNLSLILPNTWKSNMPHGEGGSSTGVDYGRSRYAAKERKSSSSESPIAGTDYQGGNVETRMMKFEPSI